MQRRALGILVITLVLSCLSLLNAQAHSSDDQRLPDYIAPCYRDDPMLSECIKSTMYGVIQKLIQGIPELDIPPIEPLFKDEIDAFDVAGFQLKITNATVLGGSKLKIVWNSASTKTKLYAFEGVADLIEVNANYDLSGFFFVPILAAGTVNFIARQVEYTVDAIVDVLPKNGIDFVEVNNVHVTVHIKGGSLWISNLGLFEVPINQLLNNRLNVRFILHKLAPIIEEAMVYILQKFSNRIFNTVPYDTFLPKGTGPVPSTIVNAYDDNEESVKHKNKEFLERIMSLLY